MSKKRYLSYFVVLPLLFVSPLWAQQAPEASLRGKADAMKKSLEKKGFIVKEGFYKSVNLAQLYCDGLADSCNGNNFGAPYHGF